MSALVTRIASIQEVYGRSVLKTQFENGSEQRRQKAQTPIIGFDISTPPMKQADADALKAFYASVGGELSAFTWVNPTDGESYACRFDGELKKSSAMQQWPFSSFTFRLKVLS